MRYGRKQKNVLLPDDVIARLVKVRENLESIAGRSIQESEVMLAACLLFLGLDLPGMLAAMEMSSRYTWESARQASSGAAQSLVRTAQVRSQARKGTDRHQAG